VFDIKEHNLQKEWSILRKHILKRHNVCQFYAHCFELNYCDFRRHARYSPTIKRLGIRMGDQRIEPLKELLLRGKCRFSSSILDNKTTT
jgi:hypothetical protein